MAKQEKFLLVSLEESESKKLAQVISNNTSRKMLNYLASADSATESEISKNLGIPLSTVHYNLSQLIKAKLVDSKEYHYSEKGKEVSHYSLAKKYIIIAPSSSKIRTKLSSILPMALVTIGAAAAVQLFSSFSAGTFSSLKSASQPVMFAESADVAVLSAEPLAGAVSAPLPVSLWILIGGAVAIISYLMYTLISSKLQKGNWRQKK